MFNLERTIKRELKRALINAFIPPKPRNRRKAKKNYKSDWYQPPLVSENAKYKMIEWQFRGKFFDSSKINGNKAFVYVIEFHGRYRTRYYIGYKSFWKDTWQYYIGSSKKSQKAAKIIEESDNWGNMKRIILSLHPNSNSAEIEETSLLNLTEARLNPNFYNLPYPNMKKWRSGIKYNKLLRIFLTHYKNGRAFDIDEFENEINRKRYAYRKVRTKPQSKKMNPLSTMRHYQIKRKKSNTWIWWLLAIIGLIILTS